MKKIVKFLFFIFVLIIGLCISVFFYIQSDHFAKQLSDYLSKETRRKIELKQAPEISIYPDLTINLKEVSIANLFSLKDIQLNSSYKELLNNKNPLNLKLNTLKLELKQTEGKQGNWELGEHSGDKTPSTEAHFNLPLIKNLNLKNSLIKINIPGTQHEIEITDLSIKNTSQIDFNGKINSEKITITSKWKGLKKEAPLSADLTLSYKDFNFNGHIKLFSKAIEVTAKELKIQNSDISGKYKVDWSANKLAHIAELKSNNLSISDLSVPSKENKKPAKQTSGFSKEPLALDFLFNANWDIKLEFANFDYGYTPGIVQEAQFSLTSRDNQAEIKIATAKIADGNFQANINLDKRPEAITFNTNIEGSKFALGKLSSAGKMLEAKSDLKIKLQATGDSLFDLIKTSKGQIALKSDEGNFEPEIFRLISTGLYKIIQQIFSNTGKGNLECLTLGYKIENGILTPLTKLNLKAGSLKLSSKGQINLPEEEVDITLLPTSNEPSISSLLFPIAIDGNLFSPSIAPALGSTLLDIAGSPLKIAEGAVSDIGDLVDFASGTETFQENACKKAFEALEF